MNNQPFEHRMSRTQRIMGLIYLPIHIFILPLLLSLGSSLAGSTPDDGTLTLIYYAIGLGWVMAFLGGYLRADFDTLLDYKLNSLLAVVSAYLVNYCLSLIVLAAEGWLMDTGANPNNAALEDIAITHRGAVVAITVFIAPLVEEPLFRGVVFGSLRRKHRVLAYVVSTALFGLYHVWQGALALGDARLLLYAIEYIPASVALAVCYDRSRTIWGPIIFHSLINALSLLTLKMLGG